MCAEVADLISGVVLLAFLIRIFCHVLNMVLAVAVLKTMTMARLRVNTAVILIWYCLLDIYMYICIYINM